MSRRRLWVPAALFVPRERESMKLIEKFMRYMTGNAPKKVFPARNELCWCGSGIKYKRCHLDKDEQKERTKKF